MSTRVVNQTPSAKLAEGVTTRRSTTIRAGATLGHVPDRSAKALVAAGLSAQGFEAHYMIEGPDGPFRVVTAQHEHERDIIAARAFISGALYSLYPPDPLAETVKTVRSEWAKFSGLAGRSVPGWSFGCGNSLAGCLVTASVRVAHQALAVDQILILGWLLDDNTGWLCPTCAGKAAGAAVAPAVSTALPHMRGQGD